VSDTEHIPNHVAIAVEALYAQWRDGEVARGTIRAAVQSIQRWENILYGYLVSSRYDVAEGFLLDLWGEIVGEKRLGLGHDDYRRVLQARILADTASDSPYDILAVYRAVTAPSTVRYYDAPPWNSYYLFAFREDPLSDAMRVRVLSMMERVRPTTRAADLREVLVPGYFGFAADTDPDDHTVLGFGAGRFSRRLV
jgi:hypothetical protein